MVATDRALAITDVARAVEERGLDGLWLPDHTSRGALDRLAAFAAERRS